MIEASPVIESETAWAEARARVEVYLQALHLTNRAQQSRILSLVLDRAAARHAADTAASPVTLAMEELYNLSESWFSGLLDSQDRPEARGIVSLLAVDAAEKWPSAFLTEEVPSSLQRSVQKCDLRGAPELQLSRMVPEPFSTPLPESTLKQLARGFAPLTARLFAFVLSAASLFSSKPPR